MKILYYTDVHYSTNSSIVQSRGKVYSTRIENCLNSLNWAENLAKERGCSIVVCGGDFFNTSALTAEEITSIKDIQWANIPHYFLVGNHELDSVKTWYNTAQLFEVIPECHVISEVADGGASVSEPDITLLFLPYVVNQDDRVIRYRKGFDSEKVICFSHNDLMGINYGAFISKDGFSIDNIEDTCDLFINGHLHNGTQVTDKIYNVGNLTGQNFSEDAEKYSHNVAIIDTETLTVELVENPYAFNFYHVNIHSTTDIRSLSRLKQNAVVSIKCSEDVVEQTHAALRTMTHIVIYRVIVERNVVSVSETKVEDISKVDHIAEFKLFCKDNIDSDLLESELQELI